MNIKDSVIIITGASTRVGREIALYLANLGANISFSYYLDTEPWQQTLADLEITGVKSLATQTEIRDSTQVKHLVNATIMEFGRVDVLINNASVWLKSPFFEITEAQWDLAMDVNLRGPFLTSQAVAPSMLAQKNGVIINITDLSAFQVWGGYAHHASSKAGLVSLTKCMAFELAPTIRVNAIAPGTVLLPENASQEKIDWATGKSVLGRIGTPKDVARLAEFIITSDFITGSVYFVDGGRNLV